MTYLGVDWNVLEASERHLTSRQVEPATITLTSLKLKASLYMTLKRKLPQLHTAKVLNAWPGHTLLNVSQFSFNSRLKKTARRVLNPR